MEDLLQLSARATKTGDIIAPTATRPVRVVDDQEPHDYIWSGLDDAVLLNLCFPIWLSVLCILPLLPVPVRRDAILEGEPTPGRRNG